MQKEAVLKRYPFDDVSDGIGDLLDQRSEFSHTVLSARFKLTYKKLLELLHIYGLFMRTPEPLHVRFDLLPSLRAYIGLPIDNQRIRAFGRSLDRVTAFSKCIGEGLERYFTFSANNSRTRSYSYEQIRDKAKIYDIRRSPSFLSEQTHAHPNLFDEKDEGLKDFRFVKAQDLLSGKEYYIPAQYIFWGDDYRNEPTLLDRTTNGGAGAFTKEDSIAAGILEYIQRDSFLLYWLSKKTPRRINIKDITDLEVYPLLKNLSDKKIRIELLVLENEIGFVTLVACLIDARTEPISLSVGATTLVKNSADDLSAAIENSILEALTVLDYNISAEETFPLEPKENIFLNKTFTKKGRISYWKGDWIPDEIKFFISGDYINYKERFPKEASPTKKSRLDVVRDRFKNQDLFKHIFVFMIDSPILKKIGYAVSKVFIDGMTPLYLSDAHATLRSERLAKWLLKDIDDLRIEDINHVPHMFP